MVPRPAKDLSCGLGESDYGLLGGIGHLGVGAGSTVEGVESVVVLIPEEAVCAAASDHRVVAQPAVLGIDPASAGQRVDPTQTVEGVGSTSAVYGVVGLRARQDVVLGRAHKVLHARECVRTLSCGRVGRKGGGYGGQCAGEVGCVRACAAV